MTTMHIGSHHSWMEAWIRWISYKYKYSSFAIPGFDKISNYFVVGYPLVVGGDIA